MPDTRVVENGREFPRRYTRDELEAIAKAAGIEKCGPIASEKLQRAVEAYQWASLEGIFFRAKKDRRTQLADIINLCARGSAEEIENAVSELDAPTSTLFRKYLGRFPIDDRRRLARAAKCAMEAIPRTAPNPTRARRQFIGELATIYAYAPGRCPGRRVHDQEYGPFLEGVKAALTPFKDVMGCEDDIKLALAQRKRKRKRKRKKASGRRKNAAAARR